VSASDKRVDVAGCGRHPHLLPGQPQALRRGGPATTPAPNTLSVDPKRGGLVEVSFLVRRPQDDPTPLGQLLRRRFGPRVSPSSTVRCRADTVIPIACPPM